MKSGLVLLGCFAVGFAAQFLPMRKTRRLLPRLIPLILILLVAAYALMRCFGIISYPGDGSGFFDVGGLVGIVLLILDGVSAVGSLLGFLTDRIMVAVARKRKSKKERNE